jgi:hypothetical protein
LLPDDGEIRRGRGQENLAMNLALCVVALGLAAADNQNCPNVEDPGGSSGRNPADSREIWPLRIREAMRLALENNPSLRVTYAGDRNDIVVPNCFGPQAKVEDAEKRPRPTFASRTSIVVEPVRSDSERNHIRSDIAATIRSVEKRYRELAVAHAALWAADKAVTRARELIDIEEATGDPTCLDDLEDLATTLRRLPRLEQAFAARFVDLSTAEKHFRKLLGISESDKRTVIPVTPPIEAHLAFGWASCLDTVLTKKDNPLQLEPRCPSPPQNVIEALSEFPATSPQHQSDREAELIGAWVQESFLSRPFVAYCSYYGGACVNWKFFLRRSNQQPPDAFAKAVSDVEHGYECYSKANRLRITAERQMASQRRDWFKGMIPADRYLDTVEEFAVTAERESRESVAYNSALIAVSEFQNNLLQESDVIARSPTR